MCHAACYADVFALDGISEGWNVFLSFSRQSSVFAAPWQLWTPLGMVCIWLMTEAFLKHECMCDCPWSRRCVFMLFLQVFIQQTMHITCNSSFITAGLFQVRSRKRETASWTQHWMFLNATIECVCNGGMEKNRDQPQNPVLFANAVRANLIERALLATAAKRDRCHHWWRLWEVLPEMERIKKKKADNLGCPSVQNPQPMYWIIRRMDTLQSQKCT